MLDERAFIDRQNCIQKNKENDNRYITLINYAFIDKLFECLSHLFILSLLPSPYVVLFLLRFSLYYFDEQ